MIILRVPRWYVNFKRKKFVKIIETEISRGSLCNYEKIFSIYLTLEKDLENEICLYCRYRLSVVGESLEFLKILNVRHELELHHYCTRKEDLYIILNIVKSFYK